MVIWPTVPDTSYMLAALQVSVSFVVTVDTPASGGTVNTVEFDVEWSFSGTQATFRVEIFESDQTTLTYDSGITSSSVKNHTVPDTSGLTNSTTYYVRVTVTNSSSQTGQSVKQEFSTSFAPVNDVANLTVTANNAALPHIELAWDAFTLAGTEVFVRYNVYRRKQSTTSWTRLAGNDLDDRAADLSYDDYTASPGVTYEYAVTVTVTDSGNTLESDKQTTSNTAALVFDTIYLHQVDDTTSYVEVMAAQFSINEAQDQNFVQVWGRTLPTLHVGTALTRVFTASGLQGWDTNSSMWTTLRTMVANQRDASAIFCLRFREDTYFVVISGRSRSDSPADIYTHTLNMTEIHYVEAES